jgi:hypothetical protein
MKQRLSMKNAHSPAAVNSNIVGKKVDNKTYVLLFILGAIGVLFLFMLISIITESKVNDL